jgi:hypothetical protein
MVVWTALAFWLAFSLQVPHILANRFLLGFFESTFVSPFKVFGGWGLSQLESLPGDNHGSVLPFARAAICLGSLAFLHLLIHLHSVNHGLRISPSELW